MLPQKMESIRYLVDQQVPELMEGVLRELLAAQPADPLCFLEGLFVQRQRQLSAGARFP